MRQIYIVQQDGFDREGTLKLLEKQINDIIQINYLYEYMYGISEGTYQKDLFKGLIEDKQAHIQSLKEIYEQLGGEDLQLTFDIEIDRPQNYLSSLGLAFDIEKQNVENLGLLRKEMPNRYYQDMIYDIMTDVQKNISTINFLMFIELYEDIE